MITSELQKEIKALNIMHISMCIGCTLIIILLYFALSHDRSMNFSADLKPLELFALIIGAIAAVLSVILFKKKTADLNGLTKENLNQWRQGYILKWALLEGAALINALLYFFIGNNPVLLIIVLLLLLLLYTSKAKFN